MTACSEHALSDTNTRLSQKLAELEAANRVLQHRTEAMISLQDISQQLISSASLDDLARRVCRRATELCGAERAILYYLSSGTNEGKWVSYMGKKTQPNIQKPIHEGPAGSRSLALRILLFTGVGFCLLLLQAHWQAPVLAENPGNTANPIVDSPSLTPIPIDTEEPNGKPDGIEFSPSILTSEAVTPTLQALAYLPFISYVTPEPTPTPTPTPTPSGPPADLLRCTPLSGPLTIPDNSSAGVNSRIRSTDGRYIYDLDVYIHVSHSWVSDIKANLTHIDTGKTVPLIERPGYPANPDGCSNDDMITILDDEASLYAEDQCSARPPAISGTYRPVKALSPFIGDGLAGEWVLNIADLSSGDTGRLDDWCLDVSVVDVPVTPTPTPPAPVLPDRASVPGMSGQNQAMPLDCESRSAVDWTAHFGVDIKELDFFNNLPASDNPDTGFVGDPYGVWGQIPPDPYGVHAIPIAKLLRQYGLSAYAHRSLSWNDLRSEIAAGRPAIVWTMGNSYDTAGIYYPVYYTALDHHTTVVAPFEHTVILTGYTPNNVTILDGASIYTRTIQQFLVSWSVLRNMAVTAKP